MATEDVPVFLEGKLVRDRLGWSNYVQVDGVLVSSWIWKRLADMPQGATVRITAEVVDASTA